VRGALKLTDEELRDLYDRRLGSELMTLFNTTRPTRRYECSR
jgi:hypothetical protein